MAVPSAGHAGPAQAAPSHRARVTLTLPWGALLHSPGLRLESRAQTGKDHGRWKAQSYFTNEKAEGQRNEIAQSPAATEWLSQTHPAGLFLLLQTEALHANITELGCTGNSTLLYFTKIKLDLIPPLPGLWKNLFFLALGGGSGALLPWVCARAPESNVMLENWGGGQAV